LAGMAIIPESFDSTFIVVVIVVSRSDADMVRSFPLTSNRKLSRMGRVLDEFSTPFSDKRFLSSVELETINFMSVLYVDLIQLQEATNLIL
jgi:hypothetical protein